MSVVRFLKSGRCNGQSITEYSVLLAIVAAALIGMQIYLKRGIQGRVRSLADQVSPVQYEPGQTTSDYMIIQNGTTNTGYSQGETTMSVKETVTRRGGETVVPERYH